MQHIIQDFEQKMFTTGGALALNKCFWYLISWTWQEDGLAKMKLLKEVPGEIFLTQGYNRENPKKIIRKEINKPEHTLGLRINPMQGMKDKITYWHKQIIKWAAVINSHRL